MRGGKKRWGRVLDMKGKRFDGNKNGWKGKKVGGRALMVVDDSKGGWKGGKVERVLRELQTDPEGRRKSFDGCGQQ